MQRKENKFPNILHQELFKHDLSYKRAAALLGIKDPQQIVLWEQGIATPTLESIFRLMVLFHINPAKIWCEYYKQVKAQMLTRWERMAFPGLPRTQNIYSFDDNDNEILDT